MVRRVLFIILAILISWLLLIPAFADVEKKSSIEQTLLNALPKDSELNIPSGFNVKSRKKEFMNKSNPGSYPGGQRYLIAEWQGYNYYNKRYRKGTGTQKGYDWMMVRFIIWYKPDKFYKSTNEFRSWHVKNPHHSSNPKEGIRVDWKPWDGLPGAMIADYSNVYTGGHGENIDCDILFLKNPSLRVEVEFSMQINSRIVDDWIPPVPFSTRQSQAKAYIRPECERLAKLVWSRLPEGKGDKYVEPPIAGVSTKGDKTQLSSKQDRYDFTEGKRGTSTSGKSTEIASSGKQTDTDKENLPEEGSLPPWAPAAAGGVAAGIAAIGSWLMMLSSGIKPKEVWDGVKDLFTQLPIQKELMSKAVDTIDTEPLPPEPSSTQLEPSITPEKPPAEVEKDFFDQAEKEIREKEIAKPPAEDETGPRLSSRDETKIPDYDKLVPVLKDILNDEVKKLEADGYWIRDLDNSKLMLILSYNDQTFNDPKGVTCGDLIELKQKHVIELAKNMFGNEAVVDQVSVEERTTLHSSYPEEWLDSRFKYNHTAVRLITPDGSAYIVDYWQALQGSPVIQTEQEWLHHYKMNLDPMGNPKDFVYKIEEAGELTTIDRFVEKQGKEIGYTEALNAYKEQHIDWIKKSGYSPKEKETKIKEVQTLINYYRRSRVEGVKWE